MGIFEWLTDTSGLTPHGFCLTWEPALLWLYAVSDGVTMLAYFSIPLALLWFMRQRRDLPHRWVGLLFVGFIIACGSTHGMSIVTLWVPAYNIEVATKIVTAVLSIATAVVLWPLVPKLLLVPSVSDMVAKNRELAFLNEELEAFSYSVSHDLRSPLRAINGYTRLLLEDFAAQLPEEARAHLQVVIANSQRMGALIDALLSFARLARAPVARRPIDIAALALEVVEEQRPSWQGRVVEVEIAALAPGDGDRALVKQVLQNLVENAGKYTRTRDVARIRIFMQAADEGATEPVYVVADNGIGFDMRYADHLFGVFQRLHPAEDYEGTGVGLATVQRIIQRHGGRIWAQARPGQGATFRFTLRPSGAEPAAAGN